MKIKNLMSGIAVVIDDKLKEGKGSSDDIFEIIEGIKKEWEMPFYETHEIPPDSVCDNLLRSASFILLDWNLWGESGGSQLEERGTEKNVKFLEKAKDFFVPVFIFTNQDSSYVADKLGSLYDQNNSESNFIFIQRKSVLVKESISNLIENWIQKNASVYTLKAWEQAFYESKRSLFSSMYKKSPDWPKVFWKSYSDDDVDPSSSMTNLVNYILLGRIRTDIFEKQILDSGSPSVSGEDIKSLMEEASFIRNERLHQNETRSGDVFALPGKKRYLINIRPDCDEGFLDVDEDDPQKHYLINIRPDCDCIPRQEGQTIDNVELYCIEGKRMSNNEIGKSYEKGRFVEKIWESISFSLYEGKTIRFDFRKFRTQKFSEVKEHRIGRLIHPYITRMQQRYALYLQRQGLPRVPEEAIPKKPKDS